MKLQEQTECVVRVKESGSNNVARIVGEGIGASSTNSSAVAVEAAVEKLIKRNRWGKCSIFKKQLYSVIGLSEWTVIIEPEL